MNKKEFFNFLDERKVATLAEVKALADDNRKDESNTLKAKANIYDIFKAIYGAFEKDGTISKEDFMARASKIYLPWEESLKVAREHGDINKTVIEEAKLSAVKEIIDWL